MMFVFSYTWPWNRTRSLLLCVLLHGSFTAALDNLALMTDSVTGDLAILGMLVGGAILLVVATRGRLGFEPAPVETPPETAAPEQRPRSVELVEAART